MIISCVNIVHQIAKFTIQIEQDRGESFEKMLLRKTELKAQAQKTKFKIQKEEDDEDNQAESDLTSQLSTLTKEFTQIK